MPKDMFEVEFLKPIVTFNAFLNLDYASRAVIAVKATRSDSGRRLRDPRYSRVIYLMKLFARLREAGLCCCLQQNADQAELVAQAATVADSFQTAARRLSGSWGAIPYRARGLEAGQFG